MAATVHAPFTGKGHFDQDQWQLYHVDADRSESTDLAQQYPEKLAALKKAWDEEARINLALPVDDRTAGEILGIERPSAEPTRDRYVYYPGSAPVPEGVAVSVRNRSYKILANVEITDADAGGVIFAQHIAAEVGAKRALSMDMWGTTAKLTLSSYSGTISAGVESGFAGM